MHSKCCSGSTQSVSRSIKLSAHKKKNGVINIMAQQPSTSSGAFEYIMRLLNSGIVCTTTRKCASPIHFCIWHHSQHQNTSSTASSHNPSCLLKPHKHTTQLCQQVSGAPDGWLCCYLRQSCCRPVMRGGVSSAMVCQAENTSPILTDWSAHKTNH